MHRRRSVYLIDRIYNKKRKTDLIFPSAQYTDDIPPQKNELYGVLVLSTKPHAKILDVDVEAAMDLPGVVEWVDHRDLASPEANWWGAPSCEFVSYSSICLMALRFYPRRYSDSLFFSARYFSRSTRYLQRDNPLA